MNFRDHSSITEIVSVETFSGISRGSFNKEKGDGNYFTVYTPL